MLQEAKKKNWKHIKYKQNERIFEAFILGIAREREREREEMRDRGMCSWLLATAKWAI